MARILTYTTPSAGHLFPVAPILLELRARGHEVAVRTLASQVQTMRGLGLDAAAVDPRIEAIPLDDYRARTPVGANRRNVRTFCKRALHEVPDLRAAIERHRPDAVLVDVNAFGAVAAAEAWGGSWALFCPYPLPLPSREAPPFGLGLRPARGRLGRLRDAALRPLVFGALERTLIPGVNEIRARVGLPPVANVTALLGAPPLLIYLSAEPFEYPRSDWPANVRMVGPCAWEPPAEPPAWLEDGEDPIVLISTSSEFQDDARLARCALQALADEPLRVVVTAPALGPGEFGVPANARVLSFAPHSALLDRAVCAITHGGMGATQKALARGCRSARCRSAATSSRWHGGCNSRVPAQGFRPENSAPGGYGQRSSRRSAAGRERGGWRRPTRKPAARPRPQMRSSTCSVAGQTLTTGERQTARGPPDSSQRSATLRSSCQTVRSPGDSAAGSEQQPATHQLRRD